MRAIVSVSDKNGLVEFARGLVGLDVELFATGGTLAALETATIPVKSVTEITGFPEILDGLVKTLHPSIYAGILARRDLAEHLEQIARLGIAPIDLVVVNLYPFTETIERGSSTLAEAIETIDVGGPALIRAAAKNYQHVITVVDPEDYVPILAALKAGGISESARRKLAAKAYQHTAVYDTHVSGYLREDGQPLPDHLTIALEKLTDLRYGENPHQAGALYVQTPDPRPLATLAGARQLNGKLVSFTNTLDLNSAFECVRDFAAPAVAIFKHGNPCGLAVGERLWEAFSRARNGDPAAASGSGVAFNRAVDAETASLVAQTYFEDILAPGYEDEALDVLKQSNPDLRVFEADFSPFEESTLRVSPTLAMDFKRVSGGFLVQTPDVLGGDDVSFTTTTAREPTLDELTDLIFAWRAVKYVKSNAIVLARRLSLVGIGAGQTNRADALEIAIRKAANRSVGSVLASDAYFATADLVETAASAGVTAIVQPGGALRDEEIARTADRHHIALVRTSYRHFRH